MTSRADLVYDVGMHNGDDTAYYLHRGYRVVAVEANPALAEKARHRFGREIAAGRLEVLNVGIAAADGEAEFYVSDVDVWSSFDREAAGRWGTRVRAVRVPCRRFDAILAAHGVPHYLKIDIEGSEPLCLDALRAGEVPEYLSIEMSHREGDRHVGELRRLGYTGFKCVRQNDLVAMTPENLAAELAWRRRRGGGGLGALAGRAWRRARLRLRPPREGDWVFRRGSSGPFGPALAGRWLDGVEMLDLWRELRDASAELRSRRLEWWFDVHAHAPPAGERAGR